MPPSVRFLCAHVAGAWRGETFCGEPRQHGDQGWTGGRWTATPSTDLCTKHHIRSTEFELNGLERKSAYVIMTAMMTYVESIGLILPRMGWLHGAVLLLARLNRPVAAMTDSQRSNGGSSPFGSKRNSMRNVFKRNSSSTNSLKNRSNGNSIPTSPSIPDRRSSGQWTAPETSPDLSTEVSIQEMNEEPASMATAKGNGISPKLAGEEELVTKTSLTTTVTDKSGREIPTDETTSNVTFVGAKGEWVSTCVFRRCG